MWVQPRYCLRAPSFVDRPIAVGFVGSLHPYRMRLFEQLEALGIHVNVQAGNSLPYERYMQALSTIQVFIHSEDSPLVVDGQAANLRDGLWIKDVEAAARGCFSIRNSGAGTSTYCDGLATVLTYDTVDEVPRLLAAIQGMDPQVRQATLDGAVGSIERSDRWQETASLLLTVG